MGSIGIWLLTLGVADVVCAIIPTRLEKYRRLAGTGCAGFIALLVGFSSSSLSWRHTAVIICAVAFAYIWVSLQSVKDLTKGRSVTGVILILGTGFVLWILAAVLPEFSNGILEAWLENSPFELLAASSPGKVILLAGCIAVQLETGNVLVRMVLSGTNVALPGDRSLLQAGRIIGPIERILIFGFAFSGELAAAALIASAKSILRFPEISARRGSSASLPIQKSHQPDDSRPAIFEASEYFLLGSLTSWAVALLPAAVLFAQ